MLAYWVVPLYFLEITANKKLNKMNNMKNKHIFKSVSIFLIIVFSSISCASISNIVSFGIGLGLGTYYYSNILSLEGRENLDSELESMCNNIIRIIKKEGRAVIAIVGFNNLDTQRESYLGRYVSEYITDYISKNSRDITVVERSQIVLLNKELEKSYSGQIDQETAISLGKLTGSETIVLGTLSYVGERIKTSMRVCDVQSGEIIGSVSGNITGKEAYKMYNTF